MARVAGPRPGFASGAADADIEPGARAHGPWRAGRRDVVPKWRVAERLVSQKEELVAAPPLRLIDDPADPSAAAANDSARWLEAVEQVRQLVHDLRNPVGSVGMAVELLRGPMARALSQVDPVVRAEVTSVLEALSESAAQLRYLVGTLQDVAPPSTRSLRSGQDRPSLTLVEAAPVRTRPDPVTEVDELLRRLEILTVTRSSIPALLAVDAERGMRVRGAMGELLRALSNLVENAIEATAASDVGEGPYTVELAANRGKDEVFIEVRDTGAGLPAEVVAYLVSPRAEAAPSVSSKRDGGVHGVGLAAVRRIAEDVGGRLEASRVRDQTVMRLILPLV